MASSNVEPSPSSQAPSSRSNKPSPASAGQALPLACSAPGAELETVSEEGVPSGGGVVSFRGALNDDAQPDLIVRYAESCSGYGECERSVYFGCGQARFVRVYGPEYSVSLEPDSADEQGVRRLRELRRNESVEQPGATAVILHYAGGRFVER